MYRQGESLSGRRQMVKNGIPFEAAGAAPGAFAGTAFCRMNPMLTPRSPLDATIARSELQLIVDGSLGFAPLSVLPINSLPTRNAALVGPPMFIASALPYFVKAGPTPMRWASSEKSL